MQHITEIRTAVCTLANKLRAAGYGKRDSFLRAWAAVSETAFRVAGATFENRQTALSTLAGIPADDVRVVLHREADNSFDSSAVAVWAVLKGTGRGAKLGYLPRVLAARWAAVLDKGVRPSAAGRVIGTDDLHGFLVSMAV